MDDKLLEARGTAWDRYAGQPIEFTISEAFNAGFESAWNEWVRIETEADLPKEKGYFLVTVEEYDGPIVFLCYWTGEHWDDSSHKVLQPVIAYIPLPAPYQPAPNGSTEGE